jgi:hypothetical protein
VDFFPNVDFSRICSLCTYIIQKGASSEARGEAQRSVLRVNEPFVAQPNLTSCTVYIIRRVIEWVLKLFLATCPVVLDYKMQQNFNTEVQTFMGILNALHCTIKPDRLLNVYC